MTALLLVLSCPIVGWWLFGRLRPIDASPPRTYVARRRLDIIIPARNEEASLRNLLEDLASNRPRHCRVTVVDDHSSDSTAEIAASFDFVTIVGAPPLPAGWCGKNWACHVGVASSRSTTDATEWSESLIVFLDADVRLAPGALEQIDHLQQSVGGVVSIAPFHRVPTAVEQLSGVFNLVSILGSGAGTHQPRSLFGPTIACTTADYERIGGHESVHAEILDDLALAEEFRRADIGIHIRSGGNLVAYRMYPTGGRALLEGWSKNISSGAGRVPLARTALVAWWITGLLSGVSILADPVGTGTTGLVLSVAAYALCALGFANLLTRIGSFWPLTAVAFPVLAACFVVVFAYSWWTTNRRKAVQWRGRTIPVPSQS